MPPLRPRRRLRLPLVTVAALAALVSSAAAGHAVIPTAADEQMPPSRPPVSGRRTTAPDAPTPGSTAKTPCPHAHKCPPVAAPTARHGTAEEGAPA